MGDVTLLLALAFPLTELAKATSSTILLVFPAFNLALWRVRRRHPDREGEGPRYPPWLPLKGGLSCLAVPAFQLSQLF